MSEHPSHHHDDFLDPGVPHVSAKEYLTGFLLSLLLTAAISIAVTVCAGMLAIRYFEHTRLQATRRQLARLGIGELASLMPDAGSHASAEAAAGQVAATNAEAPVKKGLGVDVTPP